MKTIIVFRNSGRNFLNFGQNSKNFGQNLFQRQDFSVVTTLSMFVDIKSFFLNALVNTQAV